AQDANIKIVIVSYGYNKGIDLKSL
ncbi:phosphoglycolate phosphatase, partial [Francisella tularensis subsp. holarctica]|nr:phosphoglycolate phosphatase [Francisella tularensis subsp. holarctica]